MRLNPPPLLPLAALKFYDSWNTPVRFIKFTATAGSFTDICIICSTGGTKNVSHFGSTSVNPATPDFSIQYNDVGFVAGGIWRFMG